MRSWQCQSEPPRRSDLDDVNMTMRHMGLDDEEEQQAYLRWLWYRTRSALSVPWHWAAVQAVANELLAQRVIGERRARRLIKEALDEAWEDEGITL